MDERREALIRLAGMTGIADAQEMSDARLENDIHRIMDDLMNQFYLYNYSSEDEGYGGDEGITACQSEDQAYMELEIAEESGNAPSVADVSEHNYAVLNALSFDECKFLYRWLHSDDEVMRTLSYSAFILSVRACICSLIQRVHFQPPADRQNREPLRNMRSAGIAAASRCLQVYDPTAKGASTYFTFTYNKIWRHLLGEMYGYDPDNDGARLYHVRKGKIDEAIRFFESQNVANPTDEQIAAYINQRNARNKEHSISAETVRAIRKPADVQEEGKKDPETDTVETLLTIKSILEQLPDMQRDVIKIIMHLNEHGEAVPEKKNILALMKLRYPNEDEVELESTIISAKMSFKKLYYGSDDKTSKEEEPLIEAILHLDDYTDEMLNLIENTDPSELF